MALASTFTRARMRAYIPTMFAIRSRTSLSSEEAASTLRNSPSPDGSQSYNVIIFGESGAGKSSTVNLITGKQVAKTSPDAAACTFTSRSYHVNLEQYKSYHIWDTVGLNEPEIAKEDYLRSIKHAYKLINELERSGGVHLLLLCMRGRITKSVQQNYRLFVDVLCEKKISLGVVVTHLENEPSMEKWWTENSKEFKKYGISANGHACITTIPGVDGCFEDRKEESRTKMRQLLLELTMHSSNGWKKEGLRSWFANLLGKMMNMLRTHTARPTHEDLVKKLINGCSFSRKDAVVIANSIEEVRAQSVSDWETSSSDDGCSQCQ